MEAYFPETVVDEPVPVEPVPVEPASIAVHRPNVACTLGPPEELEFDELAPPFEVPWPPEPVVVETCPDVVSVPFVTFAFGDA